MRNKQTLKLIFFMIMLITSISDISAQNSYRYEVDLTKVINDELTVNLQTPSINKSQVNFYLPKIVPGTYMNSNYGKYVHNLKAFTKAGKSLPVVKTGDNSWAISKANTLHHLSYNVEDTWDASIDNKVYSMCGTSFEAGKAFVLNTPGLFGYFEGMKNLPFELNFTKPSGFYGATGLVIQTSTATNDLFLCNNADHLYDSPIMYSLPDTASISLGSTQVLVAVYSPHKKATAAYVADHLKTFLAGARDYLGGKLPVNKYAFLFYFNGEQPKMETSGAWEHSYSSFYSLEETPQEESIKNWVDIAAHEFFHIVTPLTISSREVKQFDFNNTNLSKHLWLYEGSTEYFSKNMQVWAGLASPAQYLQSLSDFINYSRTYFNDSLSFTVLSKGAADTYADQYGNVYMKGALISACLDLQLLQWSNGQYGIRQLKHDLGVNFGTDKFFEDDSLFSIIARLSYPGIQSFFTKYVEGGTPIPYADYFAMAGVQYIPEGTYKDFSLGGLNLTPTPDGAVRVGVEDMNEIGKAMGYQEGDELISLNDAVVDLSNLEKRIGELFADMKEGEIIHVKVKRKNKDGAHEVISLSAPAKKVEKKEKHVLRFIPNPTAAQVTVRNAWMNDHQPSFIDKASTADVNSIDSIMNALYDVISGPAGERNWVRFRSLLHPEAYMGAVTARGEFRKFSPEKYIQNNGPFFLANSFYEKEIGRQVNTFGNIAQVFTAYEFTAGTTPALKKRGVNSIELVKENGRWFIMSISWDEERDGQKIPTEYLR